MNQAPKFRGWDRQRLDIAVLLACGCTVKRRIHPSNQHSKFPCPSNMGHGYNLAWVSYTDPDMGFGVTVNRAVPEPDVKPVDPRPSEPVKFADVVVGDRLRFGTFNTDYKRTDWREGAVTGITPRAVTVQCDGGGRAYLTAKRWSIRGVARFTA